MNKKINIYISPFYLDYRLLQKLRRFDVRHVREGRGKKIKNKNKKISRNVKVGTVTCDRTEVDYRDALHLKSELYNYLIY